MTCFFSIQSEGLVCNHDAVVYVIAAGVWHHARACISLRIDSIPSLTDSIRNKLRIPYNSYGIDLALAKMWVLFCGYEVASDSKQALTSSKLWFAHLPQSRSQFISVRRWQMPRVARIQRAMFALMKLGAPLYNTSC